MKPRPFPPALPHGELEELFPDLFFVTGTVRMAGPLPMTFSRNMTVLRSEGSLVLVNTLRLDERGLAALDELGQVEHVIRLAGFHGMDDPFYRDRYGAKVWAVEGQRYVAGFDTSKPSYFEPDAWMSVTTELPIADGRLYLFESASPPEALLCLEREGGIVVSGDCLQNWAEPDRFFSFLAKPVMRMMGFLRPCSIGPGWLKQAKPAPGEIRGILELPFEHVLPVHGAPVIGGAKARYRPAIERLG